MVRNCAYILIFSVLALLSIGLVMLTSVSAFAPSNQGEPYYFIIRQSIWLALAVSITIYLANTDYHKWTKYSGYLLISLAILMILCLVPNIGVEVNGASRWINLGFMRIQPSEFTKLGFVIFLSYWLGKNFKKNHNVISGFLVPASILLILGVLCRLQDDLGSLALLLLIAFLMMFVGGTKLRYLVPMPILGIGAIIVMSLAMPERIGRIMAFLNPEEHRYAAGHQVFQALIAFGSGGINGIGLGNGIQKMFYLPEAHTDFIFPIIGEELGVMFTLLIVFCFLLIALSGGIIAWHAKDATGLLLGIGATSLICLQAGFNIAVVTSLVPTKGIGLPFISYGGSNLLMSMICVGLILNIHRQAEYQEEGIDHKRALSRTTTVRM